MEEATADQLVYLNPLTVTYEAYQHYYLMGMLECGRKRNLALQPSPRFTTFFRKLDRMTTLIPPLRSRVRPQSLAQRFVPDIFCPQYEEHVGQYILKFSEGGQLRFAIDAQDHPDVRSPEILDWADVYFKSNKWKARHYPGKVLPIVNGNGALSRERIEYLRGLRNKEKVNDLAFISRVWGGREHNIRLFEEVAKLDCKKTVLAIFTAFDRTQPETVGFQRRLDKAGVPWSFDEITFEELNETLARSRCVLLRVGKYRCIPWRMLDLLCLGACIIIDSSPWPDWPVPLADGVNYISLGIERNLDEGFAPSEQYQPIPDKISRVVTDSQLQRELGKNNKDYFDSRGAPDKVAEYVITTLENRFRNQQEAAQSA